MQKYFIFGLMAMLAACSSDKGDGLSDGWMNYRNTGVPTNNNGITSMVHNDELKLDTAVFTLSDDAAGFGTDMKFAVSNGVITGIKFGDGDDSKTAVRTGGNTGFFRWKAGANNRDILMGGSSEDGLQYSNFGRIVFNGDSRHYATYTGGYKSNEVTTIATDMSFKGHATGYVHGRDNKDVLPVYGDATLNVTSGGATSLTANFKDWYTVDIADGKMNFSGYETDEKNGENYMFTNKSVNIGSGTYFKTTYYGPDKNTPSEVVGSFGHAEAGNGDDDAGVRLDAAFGGVKK